METQAQRLTRLREEREWSQETLADQAGVSQGTVGNIESGKRGYGAKSLLGISAALEVSPKYLLCETDENVLVEPLEPRGDFSERPPVGVSTEEWSVLQDLRAMSDAKRHEYVAAIRKEADDARSIAERAIAAIKGLKSRS